jgi:hypothetical protein
MDNNRSNDVTREIASLLTRRRLAGGLGLSALALPGLVEARHTHRHKHHTKKPKFNDFGCVNVGGFCKNESQCCSGICTGKRCQAHDESTCQPGEDACAGNEVVCTTIAGEDGTCVRTTGGANYCQATGTCFACRKDADCVEACREARAACIVCAECAEFGGAACLGITHHSCQLA